MTSAPRRLRAVATALVAVAGAAVAIAAQPQAPVGGPPAGLALTPSFSEDFDGASLDTTRWRTAYRTDGVTPATVANRSLYGNRERELYFDPGFLGLGVQPFSVADGALTITAAPMAPSVREAVAAAVALQPESIRNSPLKDVSYSSGLITTKGSFSQLYGYFEIRARWTGGKGLWPAFWALPADGAWPPEFDVLEALGHEPTTIYHSVHSKQTGKAVGDTTRVAVGANTSEFHTYGMLWTKDEVRFYLDGRQTAARPTPADAHKPMYLLANLAVGGYWPGDPTATTPFPATMTIDYVRAWRLAE